MLNIRFYPIKKAFLLLVIFAITSSFANPVSGSATNLQQQEMSLDKVITWAKQLVPWYTANYEYQTKLIEVGDLTSKLLKIEFYHPDNPFEDTSSFLIDLSQPRIFDYSAGYLERQEVIHFPFKVSREKAKTIAQAFIYKAVPSLQGTQLLEVEDRVQKEMDDALLGPSKYQFEFIQEKQGPPYQMYDIRLNADGKVIGFNSSGEMSVSLQEYYEIYNNSATERKLPDIVAKHKEKKSLEALFKYHIFSWNETIPIKPDQSLKLGDLFRIVKKSISPYSDEIEYEKGTGAISSDVGFSSDYYPYVFYFYKQNWVVKDKKKKLYVDANLTRDSAAYYLTKVAGLDKLSEKYKKDPIVSKLKDYKSIKNPGAVAIMLKTGWMSAKDGQFQPNGKVTLADLAVTLNKMSKHKDDFTKAVKQ
ncbi:S-layer homology domain-containing protein [Cohnella yongneupensis]|uniref:S-layer homology domain-containing protein n=1 Tax=Cohnella yongneupensis TaxID=425006 RepID=A0ABW0QTS1_9BACL